MPDATTEFFSALEARRHEPLLEKESGHAALRPHERKADDALADRDRERRRLDLPSERQGRLRRADEEVPLRRDRDRAAERHGSSAPRRGRNRRRPDVAGPLPEALPRALRGKSHERRSRQDPRRQHLRRQRLARGHRGIDDRSDRPLLVRQPLPLDVGPDGERRAAQFTLGRRPAVLRDAFLPRPGHGHGLRRLEALGDPPAGRRRRLPRGAHDPEPRRAAGRPDHSHRCRQRLRRPVRGQGRPGQEGALLHEDRQETPRARVPPGVVRTGDHHLRVRSRQAGQEGPDLQGQDRAPGIVDHRPRRGHGRRRRRSLRPAEVRAGQEAGQTKHGAEPPTVDRRRPAARMRLGLAQDDLPPQPRRSGRSAVLPARDRREKNPAGRGTSVVHDHVRPRQHLHEPPGAPVHARARRDAR